MEYALALLVILALVAYVVVRPLVRGEHDTIDGVRLAELEAAKEAKYREIRDAQLDLAMGKLSPEDHRALDRELRAEAIEILMKLDELNGG
jgi:hypothetical protein